MTTSPCPVSRRQPVRELPEGCQRECTRTPEELFAKLDDWGHRIPGDPPRQPPGASTRRRARAAGDKQLAGHTEPAAPCASIEYLLRTRELSSACRAGGLSKLAARRQASPALRPPSKLSSRSCWRAGELIRGPLSRGRRVRHRVRAARRGTRARFYRRRKASRPDGRRYRASRLDDWLNAGQAPPDRFHARLQLPTALSSVQYMAWRIRDFADQPRPPKRFRLGACSARADVPTPRVRVRATRKFAARRDVMT